MSDMNVVQSQTPQLKKCGVVHQRLQEADQ